MKSVFYPVLCGCILLNAACVNEIESEVVSGDVPITFSVKIEDPATKVSNGEFESGDEIGLYAMISGNTIADNRYLDNLLLTCGEEDVLTTESTVFYPEGDYTLDFIAYYPYRAEGARKGSSVIPVSIEADQSNAEAHSSSDFMRASKEQVESSDKSVSLEFYHCFTKLKLRLTPGKDVQADEMIQDNPRIVATGFYTRANYDLDEQTFEDFDGLSDVVPMGEWEKDENGNLIGKEVILMPQALDGNQALQMEWNGRVYTCPMPDNVQQLDGQVQYELEITAEESESQLLDGMVASIVPWKVSEKELGGVDMKEGTWDLHLSALSFDKSNVYRVHMNGKEVAEICKEYLLSDELDSRAIVSYPLSENGAADLTRGTVLQLLDVEEDINGGSLCWDVSENTFGYTEGKMPRIQEIYFSEDGTMCLKVPKSPSQVNVVASRLYDNRNPSDIQQYSIVKVGTQYWMRENLQADRYVDGTKLKKIEVLNGDPGYHEAEEDGACYYSGEALLEGKEMSVDGWRIPSEEDWERLDDYLGGDVSLVKTGEWDVLLNENAGVEVASVSNKAMLDIAPLGVWSYPKKTDNPNINRGKQAGFWVWNYEENKISEEIVFFIGESNSMVKESPKTKNGTIYRGLSIRLVRK